MFPSCSITVSTYNRPDALKLCVESIFAQVRLPDEIIIADDGSGKETAELVASLKKISPVPFVHVRHEDNGYRLASIRNRSFVAARSDYLVQIDGDLILEKHFILDHLSMARPGTFVAGARTMMDAELTKELLEGKPQWKDVLEDIKNHKEHLDKKHNAVRSTILRKLSYIFQQNKHNYKYVLGCNMAFWKSDLLKVNGYNESFKGWGKEDNELAVRLLNAGVKIRFIKFGAVVYHLHHKVADLSATETNEEKLNEAIREKLKYAPDGMNNYMK